MPDIIFKPFEKQKEFLRSTARVRGAFSGKRGGKTEVGSIASIMMQELKPNHVDNGIDPYLGVIIAPTIEMTRRLSWKKFMAYAKPFIKSHTKSPLYIQWHDGSEVIGISADRPERLEGIKANWIYIDEVLQCSEQIFLECQARVADTMGYIFCTSSLGVQYVNPKSHWAYKHFIEAKNSSTQTFQWSTMDNPFFPKEEIARLKETLDPQTFKAMFEINWDTIPLNAVYGNFSDDNIITSYKVNTNFPVYASIDWGFAHDMAIGFFQVINDVVYLFDEIIMPNMTLEKLWEKYHHKFALVQNTFWCCDIAGKQTREQTGISNIQDWVNLAKKYGQHIKFSYRKTEITYGLPIVRSYIKAATGKIRFYIDSSCVKTIAQTKAYRYPEKDGVIINENPVKEYDDACDMVRYFYVNFIDPQGQWKPARISHY